MLQHETTGPRISIRRMSPAGSQAAVEARAREVRSTPIQRTCPDLSSLFALGQKPKVELVFLTPKAIDLGSHTKRQYGHGDAESELERSSLASLLLGHLDIFLFAGGGRARAGLLSKISDRREGRCLVCRTKLVPPIVAMGFGMVFRDRHTRLSVQR